MVSFATRNERNSYNSYSRTKNIEELVKSADIIVNNEGIPEMVKGSQG